MRCHACKEERMPAASELPFTIGQSTTIILSAFPIYECCACGAHVLHEAVIERVNQIIEALPQPFHCRVFPYEPRRT